MYLLDASQLSKSKLTLFKAYQKNVVLKRDDIFQLGLGVSNRSIKTSSNRYETVVFLDEHSPSQNYCAVFELNYMLI